VYAGGGIGGAVISLALEKLLETLGPAWTFRIVGILTLATGLPAAYLIRERFPIDRRRFVEWPLLKSLKFDLLFAAGMMATFPLFVPPFFLPLYCRSIGLSPAIGAGMVASFNFSSALGRITLGLTSDRFGPLNSLLLSLFLSALSMLTLWPLSSSLAPLIVFVVINGVANGGFFAVMPTVVSSVFGSDFVAVAMGMIVTGWAGGYLMGGPIAGYLLEAFGGAEQGISAYRPAMYYAGSTAMGAAVLVTFVRLRVNSNLLKRA
jgi:MFS family permease